MEIICRRYGKETEEESLRNWGHLSVHPKLSAVAVPPQALGTSGEILPPVALQDSSKHRAS